MLVHVLASQTMRFILISKSFLLQCYGLDSSLQSKRAFARKLRVQNKTWISNDSILW